MEPELRQILKEIQDDGAKRAEMLTEMRTVLLGPKEQPESGLMAQVRDNASRITRIERGVMYALGLGGTGGAAWNWTAIKQGLTGLMS